VLVQDSITLRRFCRIPLTDTVPHPTTLMKIMRRCGAGTVEGLHDRLIAKAIDEHDVKVEVVRGDTTVVEADVTYPTDSGLLAKRSAGWSCWCAASRRLVGQTDAGA
jgi:transposase, IS5 family